MELTRRSSRRPAGTEARKHRATSSEPVSTLQGEVGIELGRRSRVAKAPCCKDGQDGPHSAAVTSTTNPASPTNGRTRRTRRVRRPDELDKSDDRTSPTYPTYPTYPTADSARTRRASRTKKAGTFPTGRCRLYSSPPAGATCGRSGRTGPDHPGRWSVSPRRPSPGCACPGGGAGSARAAGAPPPPHDPHPRSSGC